MGQAESVGPRFYRQAWQRHEDTGSKHPHLCTLPTEGTHIRSTDKVHQRQRRGIYRPQREEPVSGLEHHSPYAADGGGRLSGQAESIGRKVFLPSPDSLEPRGRTPGTIAAAHDGVKGLSSMKWAKNKVSYWFLSCREAVTLYIS